MVEAAQLNYSFTSNDVVFIFISYIFNVGHYLYKLDFFIKLPYWLAYPCEVLNPQ